MSLIHAPYMFVVDVLEDSFSWATSLLWMCECSPFHDKVDFFLNAYVWFMWIQKWLHDRKGLYCCDSRQSTCLHHHLSALLKIYIWIRSGERLKFGFGSQKSNLEGKVLWSKKKWSIFSSFVPNAWLRGACKHHIYSLYIRRKPYQFLFFFLRT